MGLNAPDEKVQPLLYYFVEYMYKNMPQDLWYELRYQKWILL